MYALWNYFTNILAGLCYTCKLWLPCAHYPSRADPTHAAKTISHTAPRGDYRVAVVTSGMCMYYPSG